MKEQLERVERLESDMNNVYDSLQRGSAKNVLYLVRQEIEWCKQHPNESAESTDFEKGFIKGLEQAGRFCNTVIDATRDANEFDKGYADKYFY